MPRKKRPALYTPHYAWDGKWHALDYSGQLTIFYVRFPPCSPALNRTVAAIRAMERKGIYLQAKGTPPRYPNPWLYTEGQILAMVRLAEEEGVIFPTYRRPFSERFINEAYNILDRIT